MPNPVLAQVALERLRESGVDARLTSERGPADLYTGHESVIIWVPTKADVAAGIQIVEALERDSPEFTCPRCGYSLAGHSGATTCPECGRPTRAETHSVECAGCGESVPANFESCWNCGAPAEAGAALTDGGEARQDTSAGRITTAAMIVSMIVFFVAFSLLTATGVPRLVGVPAALGAAMILFFVLRRRWSPG